MPLHHRSGPRIVGAAFAAAVVLVGLVILILQYSGQLARSPWAYLGMALGIVGALGLALLAVAKAADEDRHN